MDEQFIANLTAMLGVLRTPTVLFREDGAVIGVHPRVVEHLSLPGPPRALSDLVTSNLLSDLTDVVDIEVPLRSGLTGRLQRTPLPEPLWLLEITDTDDAENRHVEWLARFPSENPNPVLRVSNDGVLLYSNTPGRHLLENSTIEWMDTIRRCNETLQLETLTVLSGERWFELAVTPVPGAGYVNVYGRDETERLAAQENARRSLEEKTLLLKEIHHRVKNNLQNVVSLLQLQRQRLVSPEAREALEDSANRVRAMSRVHQQVYEREDLTGIDLEDYLRKSLGTLLDVYTTPKPIRLDLDVEQPAVSLQTALVTGQLLNELMTNSLKYAFPPESTATRHQIRIRIEQSNSGQINAIEYADDGVGLAHGRRRGLGSELIELLARQLGLQAAQLEAPSGARYQFTHIDTRNPMQDTGIGSVLLVEDELLIAEARRVGLVTHKVAVRAVVPSAEEALSYLKANPSTSLVITDINLGRTNGIALARTIRDLYPACRLLFISGYSRSQYASDLAALGDVQWLDKNVSDRQLADVARRLIED